MATVILPTGSGADLVSAAVGVITDNIVEVLVVVGTFIGIFMVVRFLNHSKHGKL